MVRKSCLPSVLKTGLKTRLVGDTRAHTHFAQGRAEELDVGEEGLGPRSVLVPQGVVDEVVEAHLPTA